MNPIDRVVHFFNPRAGLGRMRARRQAAYLMSYDAASKGRRTYGWRAPENSADAATRSAARSLRNLSRDFLRNRPYAVRGREVVVANVVGTGIQWSVVHRDAETRARIEAVLRRHLMSPDLDARGEYDLSEMQEVVMSSVFSDGEVLARRRIRRGVFARDLALPFQIELLEVDHLNEEVHSWGANEVIDGVEYGPTGAIEAYHLFDHHPGSVSLRQENMSRRVPWQDVIHVRRIERAGQLRGVPWLAPVMMTLGELSDYQEAQILKQRMSALMAGVITWEDGARPADRSAIEGLDSLEPGALVEAPEGAGIEWTQPPQVQGYPEFMQAGLRAVAMGLGLSYESLSGDMSQANFTQGRMGRMEMDRNVRRWQHHLMVNQFCAGVARWVAEAWPMQAELPRERFEMQWTPPRRVLIDPVREIGAMVAEVDAGLTSRQSQQRALGYDPDAVRRERVEDMQEDAAAGLAAPSAPSARSVPAPQEDAPEPPADEAETEEDEQ